MIPLSEVAKDVLEAVGIPPMDYWPKDDGSNLTDPYWRCACEDWLLAHQWDIDLNAAGVHEAWPPWNSTVTIGINCPWPEAPARLVSAVWRRMKHD